MNLTIERIAESATVPSQGTQGAAGYDLYACLHDPEGALRPVVSELPSKFRGLSVSGPAARAVEGPRLILRHGGLAAIPLGFKTEFDAGWHALIQARSGIAARGIIVPNAPGLIDSDYRGEWMVLLLNLSGTPFVIGHGDRIAQVRFCETIEPEITHGIVGTTCRGEGGFGSTGR